MIYQQGFNSCLPGQGFPRLLCSLLVGWRSNLGALNRAGVIDRHGQANDALLKLFVLKSFAQWTRCYKIILNINNQCYPHCFVSLCIHWFYKSMWSIWTEKCNVLSWHHQGSKYWLSLMTIAKTSFTNHFINLLLQCELHLRCIEYWSSKTQETKTRNCLETMANVMQAKVVYYSLV